MKKDKLIVNITDDLQMLTILIGIDRFVPRGLICNIVKQLNKINNFTLTELHVLLQLMVIKLEEDK